MLFKLSLKNIKKSIKDYSIYFFTLVFAVAIFYIFNSIDAQSSMMVLNESQYDIIKTLVVLISYVSIFVSIILGFLIVYSNNFLIRRRKKEIGMYEILGMSKSKVSLILFIETVVVGLISLAVGLLIGIFLSQFISIFIAKLFEVNLSVLSVIFSKTAFLKTILYFGLIFVLVIIFNVVTLNRYKLIDLITADKKNQQVKIRNKYITSITFIFAILFTGYAYYLLIHEKALLTMDYKIVLILIFGTIGTFLLFFSLSGFLLKIFEHIKKVYYKNLNIFTLKQVNSKINTTVVSTTIICLMLLLTISLLSGSMSLGNLFNKDFADNNLTDYTVRVSNSEAYVNEELQTQVIKTTDIEDFIEYINNNNPNKYTNNYVFFHKYYDKTLKLSDLMNQEDIDDLKKEYGTGLSLEGSLPIITESEYNNFMKLLGKKTIDIKSDKYLLTTNIDMIINAFKGHYEDKKSISINGKELVPGSAEIIKIAFENSTSAGNDGLIIVDDSIVDNKLDLLNLSMVGNFVENNNKDIIEEEFSNYLNSTGTSFDYRTRTSMSANSVGLKAMLIFLGLYLGITFAISSATVLAIGELSNSSDNKKRYKVLSEIGADEKMLDKALFTQISITFVFPLIVALIHSYFALRELNSIIVAFGSVDLTSNILLTTLFMVVIYGGYFIITYLCSKSIIKNN